MAKKQPETTVVQAIIQGLDENHLVQKSRPLMQMKKVPFSLGELKVLDTYISRINSHNENSCTVKFTKNEYEDLMGIDRMHPKRLEKYVDQLMSHMVTLPHEQSPDGWRKYTLFTASACYQDEYDQWWIDLTCSEQAKELFFNIEKIGYIRYRLKNILNLTSKYSVLLYIYLLDNRFRKKWLVSVNELRDCILQCDTEFYRNNLKDFKRDILNKALMEVNDKTDIEFSMSTTAPHCKAGRNIVNIEFTLKKDKVIIENKQLTLEHRADETDEQKKSRYSEDLRYMAGAVDYEFSNDEMKIISITLTNLPINWNNDSREIHQYNFLSRCYQTMNYYHTHKKPIKERFKYLISIIENETKKEIKTNKEIASADVQNYKDKPRSYDLNTISDVF